MNLGWVFEREREREKTYTPLKTTQNTKDHTIFFYNIFCCKFAYNLWQLDIV